MAVKPIVVPVARPATPPAVRIIIATPVIRVEVSGQVFEAPLPSRPVHVGSGDSADLKLACAGVGKDHFVLQPLPDGRHVVKDLASGYPTRVNGIEAHQVSLREGDVIEVGEARIVYRPLPAEAAAPPPPAASSTPRPAPPAPARTAGTRTAGTRTANGRPANGRSANGRSAPPAAAEARPRSSHRLAGPLIGLGAVIVVALVLAFVLGSGGAKTDRAGAERRLEMALDLYRAQDYAGAQEALRALADDPSAGAVGRRAERYLKRTTAAITAAQEELARYEERALDFDLSALDTTREVFLRQHGPAFTDEFDAVVVKVRNLQTAWVGEQVGKVQAEVTPFLASGNYAKARSLWQPLLERRHLGVGLGDQVAEALAAIDTKAVADATAILAAAAQAEETDGPAVALRRVRARLSSFQGTSAYASLVDAIEGYERAIRDAAVAAQVPTPPPETPVAPPTEPTPNAASREAATVLLANADEAAKAWNFVLAAQVLADAKPTAVNLLVADRAADLALAADGHAALVADIEANPARYRGIGGGGRTKISLIGADEDTVLARVPGGQRKDRWASMSPSRVAEITGRFRATGAAALGLAALLREVGLPERVDALLVAAGEGGVETDRLFPLVARWRGETVPAAGYVVHEDRYVSPEEREHLLLLAKIAEEARRVGAKDERTWKEAAEKLLLLGPEARPALRDALIAKRTDVIGDLAKLGVFTSGKTKNKLYSELNKRRAHALALIRNQAAWPYPNPSGQNTDEVVKRVDAVREIWERPFDVIVQWSDDAKERLKLVSAVDEYIVRADPTFAPTLDEVREAVNSRVDMPTWTPDAKARSTREYSLKVLAFNEKVRTTATREERNCVLAVNEYRMMMGHWAVKINERLTRAARGHSHHMRENNYFAHDVPADKGANDTNRSPGNRARTQGYGGGVGENIARGTWSGRDAFWAWFKSSGHHRNMINRGWTEMGAGRSGGVWWTQLFGAASGKSLSLPDALAEPEAFFAPEAEDESGRPRQPGAPELPDQPPPIVPPDWTDDEPEDGAGGE